MLSQRWGQIVVGVLALLILAGLVPFTVSSGGSPSFRARCKDALIEAWPEWGGQRGGWFNYAPEVDVIDLTGDGRAAACGEEARSRATPVLMLAVLALGASTVVLSRRNRPIAYAPDT